MATVVASSRRRSEAGGGSGPVLIPLNDAIAEFGISRSTFFELMKVGRLHRYRRVGERRTLIDQRELVRLLRPRKVR